MHCSEANFDMHCSEANEYFHCARKFLEQYLYQTLYKRQTRKSLKRPDQIV